MDNDKFGLITMLAVAELTHPNSSNTEATKEDRRLD